jgi:hypothetical protein
MSYVTLRTQYIVRVYPPCVAIEEEEQITAASSRGHEAAVGIPRVEEAVRTQSSTKTVDMCDAECQAQVITNANMEAAEAENVILLIAFLLLISLVYVTGLIVWVWCNRNPAMGISAVPQTDRIAIRASNIRRCGQAVRPRGGVDGGVMLLLGALMQQQCQEKMNNTRLAIHTDTCCQHPRPAAPPPPPHVPTRDTVKTVTSLAESEDIDGLNEVVVHTTVAQM